MICTRFGDQVITNNTLGSLVYRIINDYPYIDFMSIEKNTNETMDYQYSEGQVPAVTLEIPSYRTLRVNNDTYVLYAVDLDNFTQYIKGGADNETSE